MLSRAKGANHSIQQKVKKKKYKTQVKTGSIQIIQKGRAQVSPKKPQSGTMEQKSRVAFKEGGQSKSNRGTRPQRSKASGQEAKRGVQGGGQGGRGGATFGLSVRGVQGYTNQKAGSGSAKTNTAPHVPKGKTSKESSKNSTKNV